MTEDIAEPRARPSVDHPAGPALAANDPRRSGAKRCSPAQTILYSNGLCQSWNRQVSPGQGNEGV